MQDPLKSKSTCFDQVAISSALTELRNTLALAQAARTKRVGYLEIVSAKVSKIDLTNRPKESPLTIPTVTVDVCYDVSKLDIVDATGKSIVPSTRKPRAIEKVAVVNYKYPDPTQWRVGYVVLTGNSC